MLYVLPVVILGMFIETDECKNFLVKTARKSLTLLTVRDSIIIINVYFLLFYYKKDKSAEKRKKNRQNVLNN